ncbi:ATP-dependent Zn protease, partial [Vibrio parahaemolyticus]|nr:ATP-dependent Zn protease [Vibrio parahaemolyticus]
KFPILLGRSFFRDIAVVDVSKKYIQDKPTKSTKK